MKIFFSLIVGLLTIFYPLEVVGLWAADSSPVLSQDAMPLNGPSEPAVYADKSGEISKTLPLPAIYEISINMIYPGEGDKKTELIAFIKTLLNEGKEKDAAQRLGSILGRERKKSKAYLGLYCRTVLLQERDLNRRAQFLSWFLSGYGKAGVLMVSTEGIKKLSASGKRRGKFWKFVEEGKVPSEKIERIYKSDDAVYIPFSSGEIFIVDIFGSDQGKAALWKILPESVNQKAWQSGLWEREITIRGDRAY
ncbi:MAG: hypothetical protein PHO18_03295 [Synergistaceae bacterium]|nr:hypothetical protein [Synergistaceae bacterium]